MEEFFEQITALPEGGEFDPAAMAALAATYGAELEFASLLELVATHRLAFPGAPGPQ